jgi:hypothetical protein
MGRGAFSPPKIDDKRFKKVRGKPDYIMFVLRKQKKYTMI